MLDKIRKWLTLRSKIRTATKNVSALEKSIARKQEQAQFRAGVIRDLAEDIRTRQKELEELSLRLDAEIGQAETDRRSMEQTLQSARDEIRLLKEVTIPGLVQSHDVLMARWEAQVRVEQAKVNISRTNQ